MDTIFQLCRKYTVLSDPEIEQICRISAFLQLIADLTDADIFIAIGTSGHVYPAAGFVHEARLHGAHTVELNLEPSQVGSEFAEKHYGLASEVVPAFIDKLLQENAL